MTRRVSIRDVARASGVAVATVSRSLNGDAEVAITTRERVQRVAEELGYRPSAAARGLVRGRTGNIAVAITAPHTPVFLNPFYAEVLGGIEESLEANDLHLLISSLKRGADLAALIAERRVDGLIVVGVEAGEADVRALAALAPLVLVDRELDGVSGVTTDHEAGMHTATRYLIERGRRRLAFIAENLDNPNFARRLRGFQRALLESGLDASRAPVLAAPPAAGGGRAATAALLERFDPDGLVGANDPVALGAILALEAAERAVPDDVAVVGFDGLHDAVDSGRLTTMWVDKQRMGREAARLLLERLDRPGLEAERVVVPTALRVGRSAG